MKSSLLALVLVLVFAATASAADTNGCWDGVDGAYGRWTEDNAGGLTDQCGSTDVTNHGATSGAAGYWNEAYDFERGDTDYQVNTSDYGFAGAASICAWFKPESLANYMAIAAIHQAGSNDYYSQLAILSDNTNHIRTIVGNGGGSGICLSTATTAWTAGAWLYGCAVYNTTHTIIYFNGTAQDTDACAITPYTAGTEEFSIGSYNAGDAYVNYASDGLLDEIQVYRYALSSTAVSFLYTHKTLFSAPSITITPTFAPVNESQLFTANAAGNSSTATAWYWTFNYSGTDYFTGNTETSTQTLNATGVWGVTVIGTFGGTNYTGSQNVTVAERPDANFTITSTAPYMVGTSIQFNDTSTSPGGFIPMSAWDWDFDDGNTSAVRNATNTFVLPGEYTVCLNVTDSLGLDSADDYCDDVTINGFAIDVFDEITILPISNWNVTITNSTGCSYNATLQDNTWVWSNFSSVCTGSVTIVVSASGYVARTYYGVFNVGSYINLDAYLLDSASGIYPVFIVKNEQDVVIEGAILTFMKSIGGAYVTVAQATTDVTGTTQVYLDPTVIYYLTVTATNYNTYTTSSFRPVSTTYVITLTQNTTFNFSSAEGFLYMRIGPDIPTVGNKTMVQFICNDPWSNVQDFSISIIHANGTQIYYANSSASASCGILEVNTSSLMGNITVFTRFTVVGRILRNGVNYTIYRDYGLQGSWASGLAKEMGEWAGRDANDPFTFNKTGGAVITKGTANILSFIVVAAATLGASIMFGFGAGIIGIAVGGFLVYMGWLMWELWLLAFVLCLLVYASKGVVR